jgi:hypothetical protein
MTLWLTSIEFSPSKIRVKNNFMIFNNFSQYKLFFYLLNLSNISNVTLIVFLLLELGNGLDALQSIL